VQIHFEIVRPTTGWLTGKKMLRGKSVPSATINSIYSHKIVLNFLIIRFG